jgi:hypothetical protein
MLPSYVPHPKREVKIRSAVSAIKALLPLDLYVRHKQELISLCLCKITEADGKWNTRYRTQAATWELSPSNLRHEHVFSRRTLVERLLESPTHLDGILRSVIGCVVTTKEHALLKVFSHKHPDLDGWSRFEKAGVKVLDLLTEAEADLTALAASDASVPNPGEGLVVHSERDGARDLVSILGGQIDVTFTNETEGRVVLQELRLRRKAFNLRKYAINEEQRTLLDSYAGELGQQGQPARTPGRSLGASDDQMRALSASRARLARGLAPLEREKQQIDGILQTIESVIVQVEAEMLTRDGLKPSAAK